MNIIYIIGKSSSGKDTIFKELKNVLKVNPYIMYTTRPIRSGEKNGVDYHFINQKEIDEYKVGLKPEKLIESRTYNTQYGPWTYATIYDTQFKTNQDLITVGTLESYKSLMEFFDKNDNLKVNLIPVYIELEDSIRLERAINREKQQKNPKYDELCRRFLADEKDFSEENLKKCKITKRFQNIKLDEVISEIVDYIDKQRI